MFMGFQLHSAIDGRKAVDSINRLSACAAGFEEIGNHKKGRPEGRPTPLGAVHGITTVTLYGRKED